MYNKFIAVIVLITVSLSTPAYAKKSEFKKWLKKSKGEHYQQTEFKLQDQKGDAYLIKKLDQIPMKLIKAIFKKNDYPQADANERSDADYDAWIIDNMTVGETIQMLEELEKNKAFESRDNTNVQIKFDPADYVNVNEYDEKLFKIQKEFDELQQRLEDDPDYSIGTDHPFHLGRMLNAFKRVIQDHPEITPTYGAEHVWSDEAKRYMIYGWWHRLVQFIFKKENNFPAPLLFRSKLFLCLACGFTSRYTITTQEALLEETLMKFPDRSVKIHDVFEQSYIINNGNIYLTLMTAENMLAKNPYREDRQNDPIQKKLEYLRNDNMAFGDNYGAWYHFYGIAMYAYLRPQWMSRSVAEIESLGSIVLEGKDKQEDYINRLGAIFGHKLKKMIQNKVYNR